MQSTLLGRVRGAVAVAVALVLAAPCAMAQDQDGRSVDKLLEKIDRLERRVVELESSQADAGQSVLESRINALSESVAALPAATDFQAAWKNGTSLANEDGTFKISIGGRLHNDWVWGTQDEDLEASLGNNITDGTGMAVGFSPFHYEDGVEFRRARMHIGGTIHQNVVFKVEFDFAGGDADFRNVYIGLKNVAVVGNVLVGHFKQPFGLEEATSSRFITFMERSAATDAFAPAYETGIMAYNNALDDDRLFWAVSFFRDVNDYGDSSPVEDGNYGVAVRITGLPFVDEDSDFLLHIGGGFVYNNPNGESVRYRARPTIHLSERFVDTGTFATDDIMRYNAEIAVVLGSFSAQGEYFFVDNDGGDVIDECPGFWGGYFQVSYFLTGEMRPYDRKHAAFTRVKPNENALDGSGGMGAWEVGARIDYIDLNDDFQGGEMYNITVGITWYINANTQVKLNYVYSNVDELAVDSLSGITGNGSGEAHIFGIRFQIDF
ncbi:MAG: porin [Planctomycetota bacterium]